MNYQNGFWIEISCSGASPHCWLPCYALRTACLVSQPEVLLHLFVLLSPELSHSSVGSVSANRWEGAWGGRGCQGAPKDHLCGQGMHSPSQGHGNICLPPALHLLQRSRTTAVPAVPGTSLTLHTPESSLWGHISVVFSHFKNRKSCLIESWSALPLPPTQEVLLGSIRRSFNENFPFGCRPHSTQQWFILSALPV